MGTTAEKLSYLNETKTKIKNALETPSNTFRDYPTMIKKYIDNQPTKTATDGICNNAVELPIVSLGADGNSEQEATAGYQLFDWNGVSTPTIATYENGVAKLMWTGGFDVFFLNNSEQYLNDLDTTKEYTISFKHKGNAIRMSNYATSQYNVDTNNDNDYAKYSFTVTGVSFIRLDVIRKDTSGTAYIKELMVYEGTDDKVYEKYTGGIPSPNPDCKQDIEVIDGCNIFNGNFTTNGIWKDDGTINYTIQSKLYWRTDFVKIPNKNIFFSDNKLNIFSSAKLLEFDADKKYITSNKIYQVNSNLNKVSLNENTKFIAIQWDLQNEAEIESLFTEFQITEGTSPKPYLPYGCTGLEHFTDNILQMNDYSTKDLNVDIICKNNEITLNGTQSSSSASGYRTCSIISSWVGNYPNFDTSSNYLVLPAGDYTVKNIKISGTAEGFMPKLNVTKGNVQPTQILLRINEDSEATFTLTEESVIRLSLTFGGIMTNYKIRATLCKGTSATNSLYKEKIYKIDLQGNTLARVGDTKDKLIIHRNGEAEIEKNTWKDTINTSSLITLNNGNKGLVFVTSKNKKESMSDSDYLITNA